MKASSFRASVLVFLSILLIQVGFSQRSIGAVAVPSECPHAVILLMPPAQTNLTRAFTATLNGANERPMPVNTPGSGRGTFTLNGDQLSVEVTYLGLKAPLTVAHIHGPATSEQAAGVLVGLVPDIPALATRAGAIRGTVTVTQDQIDLIESGMTYVNLHSSAHPSGEIRGQLIPGAQSDYSVISLNGKDARIILDGSTSWDPEGDPLNYVWYDLTPADKPDGKSEKKSSKKRNKPAGPACDPVAELTLRYNGPAEAAVGVVQPKVAVLFFEVVQPGQMFTFSGAGKKGTMSPKIEVFLDGDINAALDTSGKTLLAPGTMAGAFEVVSGRTTSNGDLCSDDSTNPEECPFAKPAELTLEYTGTAASVGVGVAQKGKAVLFFEVLQPGDRFTFQGAGKKGDLGPEIAVFINGNVNAVFDTSGKSALSPGQADGDFLVVSGRTIDGGDLCAPAAMDGRVVFGREAVAERTLSLGFHTLELEVSDGNCTNSASVVVEVTGVGGAIDGCVKLVESAAMHPKQRKALKQALQNAGKDFAKGKLTNGMKRLRALILVVQAAASISDADKEAIKACTQDIVDAL